MRSLKEDDYVCERRVPRARGEPVEPGDALAAGAGAPGPPGMRWPRRRRHRHVLHGKLRADDDAGARDARAGSLAARAAAQGCRREDLTVMAYRFAGDKFCRAERFAAYAAALGDRFVGRVLPDSAANTDVAPFFARHVACPHSVVTAHLIDEAGQPTIAARDEILAFFRRRLLPPR